MMTSSLVKSITKTLHVSHLQTLTLKSLSSQLPAYLRTFGSRADSIENAHDAEVPASGISRPLSEILKELNKRVPDSLIRTRVEDGFSAKYIPWHIVNRIMNLHAPEWSGEVRSITYSTDGKSVSVVYRVTLYGTDAEGINIQQTQLQLMNPGMAIQYKRQKPMAFCRACARSGLGLHLYHEDLL